MHTRLWASTGEDWISCEVTENDSSFILQNHPDGIPDLVPLSFAKSDLSTFETDVKKMKKFPWMKQEHMKEWEMFLQKIKTQKGKN
jgi:hypothetical protein